MRYYLWVSTVLYLTVRIEENDYITGGFFGTGQSSSNKPLAFFQSHQSNLVGKVGLDVAFEFALQFDSVRKVVNEKNFL